MPSSAKGALFHRPRPAGPPAASQRAVRQFCRWPGSGGLGRRLSTVLMYSDAWSCHARLVAGRLPDLPIAAGLPAAQGDDGGGAGQGPVRAGLLEPLADGRWPCSLPRRRRSRRTCPGCGSGGLRVRMSPETCRAFADSGQFDRGSSRVQRVSLPFRKSRRVQGQDAADGRFLAGGFG
jgi:hypothetical protein